MPETERGDFLLHDSEVTADQMRSLRYRPIGDGTRGILVRDGWGIRHHTARGTTVVICGNAVDGLERAIVELTAELDVVADPAAPALPARFRDVVGHFAAVVATASGTHVVTDHLGSTPVYRAESRGTAAMIGTDLTDLAALTGAALDEGSVREFVQSGSVSTPHTLFEGLSRQWPATVCSTTAAGSRTSEPYWLPPAPTAVDVREVAEAYRGALHDLMRRLRARSGGASLLFSGGEDSRVLAAVGRREGLAVEGIVLHDEINREIRHARRAARLLGMPLHLKRRSADTYPVDVLPLARFVGPGTDLIHGHVHGLLSIDTDTVPVLDGWYAEIMKGVRYPHTERTWRGHPVTRQRPLDRAADRPPAIDRSEDEDGVLAARLAEKRRRLDHLPALSAAEWTTQYPASDQYTYGFFALTQRVVPAFAPFALHPLVELAAIARPADRLNRTFMKAAFRSDLGAARWVPRDDGSVFGAGGRSDLVATFVNREGYALAQRARRALGRDRYEGSWLPPAARFRLAERVIDACDEESVRWVSDVSADARLVLERRRSGAPFDWKQLHRVAQVARLVQELA